MPEIKEGRWKRALGLSKLGASFAIKQGKAFFSGKPAQVHKELAELLTDELGKMKGLPMKIGQLLSYMDGMVPDEYRDVYREAMAKLQTKVEPLEAEVCFRVFEEEFGSSVLDFFDTFDQEPIAAASIGQVYRATYEGKEVCVKIQYPGIQEATRSDLKNIGAIVKLIRTLMPNIDTEQMIEDFKVRLIEECDYRQEASYQQQFYQLYKEHPDIEIPKVVEEASSSKILTSCFLRGQHIDTFVSKATQKEKNRTGALLFQLAFGTLLLHGLFHADPHPGNLLFPEKEGGPLGLLDFGCIQPIPEAARKDMICLIEAVIENHPIEEPLKKALGIEDIDDKTMEMFIEITNMVLAPIRAEQPFHFDQEFASNIAKAVIDAKTSMATGMILRRRRFSLQREGVMFVVRNLFGLASLWGKLDARGDFRKQMKEILQQATANI